MTEKQRVLVLRSGAMFFFIGAIGLICGYLQHRSKTNWPSWA